MDVRQRASLQSLRFAQQFLDDRGDLLASVNDAPARSDLDLAVRRIEGAAAVQDETGARSRSLTRHKRLLRRALLRHNLGPIVRIVRGRPKLFPEFQDVKMPRKGASDSEVIDGVYAMLRWAPSRREQLVGQGLRPDCLERLRAAVEEFMAAIAERWAADMKHVDATTTIPVAMTDAWTAVDMLGALIDDGHAGRDLLPGWRDAQLHAPRTRRLAAPAQPDGALPALPPPNASPDGASSAPAAQPAPVAPAERRGVVRVIARLLDVDHAA